MRWNCPLDIRYQKLDFEISFMRDGYLPRNKVSAIRGGIGNMLLLGNCIEAGNWKSELEQDPGHSVPDYICEACEFYSECNVQRIYYHPMKLWPEFVQEKGNFGYFFECFDKRTQVKKGETLFFSMILIGDVIIHFPQILQAVYQLGMSGLGKDLLEFQIVSVTNQRGEKVVSGNDVCLGALRPDTVSDYVDERLMVPPDGKLHISFQTPWTQKYQGSMLKEFHADAFVDAIYRRIFLLNCFEGNETERKHPFQQRMSVSNKKQKRSGVTRYSSTHRNKIELSGLMGEFDLCGIPEKFLPYLYAGELLHIGKNCSMGFGKYVVTTDGTETDSAVKNRMG